MSTYYPKYPPIRSKPLSNRFFFHNYASHINYMTHRLEEKKQRYYQLDEVPTMYDFICREALGHLDFHEPLRDGHDYFDCILGASVVPIMATFAWAIAIMKALAESLAYMGGRCLQGVGYQPNLESKHGSMAVQHSIVAIGCFAFSLIGFLNSVISLLIRPIATVCNSWKNSDAGRFSDEEGFSLATFIP